jgi:hypothetical protein
VSEFPVLLRRTAERVADYRKTAGSRPVAPSVDAAGLRAALGGPLPEERADPDADVDRSVVAIRVLARGA